ncbi:hypothetical protein LR48_Vigan632s000800 [Vigna angularis]|uniref:Uncharacterized protein n=1 Tax=Phaseolus angularis TaxID=3914 RepID=A0A0L9TES0_PHAAN|nr:hypothetical protein LR48_Vigan632s000800 [Vigna angularis]
MKIPQVAAAHCSPVRTSTFCLLDRESSIPLLDLGLPSCWTRQLLKGRLLLRP